MANQLLFVQENDARGTCNVFFNGIKVDACDMNYKERFTQAHIVIASAFRTLKTDNIDIQIQGSADCGTYPIDLLTSMAYCLINRETFEDNFGYTRVYRNVQTQALINSVTAKM